jgi:hypothetical protein
MGKKTKIILCLIFPLLFSCGELKPLTLPDYVPPDFANVTRPKIPIPQEGKDYVINPDNTITYTISGADLLDQKVISEEAAWLALASCQQQLKIDAQIINSQKYLIITIDLQRQIAERKVTYADIRSYAAAVVAAIFTALVIFAK